MDADDAETRSLLNEILYTYHQLRVHTRVPAITLGTVS